MTDSPYSANDGGPDAQDPDALPAIETDPEILPLLDFEPVLRKVKRPDGWTPALQVEFIRRLARTGSPFRACAQMDKNVSGVDGLYRSQSAKAFRASWDEALRIGLRRQAIEQRGEAFIGRAPGISRKSQFRASSSALDGPPGNPLPGQIPNEHGEWEDEESIRRRVEAARDNITRKLLRARRLYLQEICDSPGKRAAFEILTLLPIDWDKAARLEAQPDEPYHRGHMRKPDMMLTAEAGWMAESVHGPDKKAELRKALDDYHAENGLEPIDWDADDGDGKEE